MEQRPEAVPFDLEKPSGVREGRTSAGLAAMDGIWEEALKSV